ncbi:hypothetical protein CON84_11855 [Bacillus sp. AFS094228]|nr:hypothetical protein CON84_11855 [Bacillus sp. AFS094228]
MIGTEGAILLLEKRVPGEENVQIVYSLKECIRPIHFLWKFIESSLSLNRNFGVLSCENFYKKFNGKILEIFKKR